RLPVFTLSDVAALEVTLGHSEVRARRPIATADQTRPSESVSIAIVRHIQTISSEPSRRERAGTPRPARRVVHSKSQFCDSPAPPDQPKGIPNHMRGRDGLRW